MHNEVSARFRAVSQLGIKLVTITNVSLRVNQLALKNAFVRPQALVNQVRAALQSPPGASQRQAGQTHRMRFAFA